MECCRRNIIDPTDNIQRCARLRCHLTPEQSYCYNLQRKYPYYAKGDLK